MKWFNVMERPEKIRTFNVFVGGRGIGKTYSLIDYVVKNKIRFIYLRNTDRQLQTSASAVGNPFKKYNTDHDMQIEIKNGDSFSVIMNDGEIIGYGFALSTFKNMRGLDLSDVEIVFYDEFIEKEKLRYDQFGAFIDMYETVNRNREIENGEALKIFLLSNSQNIDNPILDGLGIIPQIESMLISGQKTMSFGHVYFSLCKNEVSEAKKETALYQTISGTKYFAENIENEFSSNDFSAIQKMNLREFMPICNFESTGFYKHKSKMLYYFSHATSNTVRTFSATDKIAVWRSQRPIIFDAYAAGLVLFESYTIKSRIKTLLQL